jgi:uncharacterized membrane protein
MTEHPQDVPPPTPPPAYPTPPTPPEAAATRTSTGLDPKLAGVLAYLLWIVGGILFLAAEKENRIVRFHAAQSVVLAIAEIVVYVGLLILSNIPVIGILFGILAIVFWLLAFVVWLFLMYKAYMLERYKLPFLGNYAEKLATKPM